jgi:uncharacterized repeat protein (TIGR03803 family)
VTNDGKEPEAGLVLGSDGNFYGTTSFGGSALWGTVFKMTPSGTVTILHSFGDGSVTNDGLGPRAGLILGSDGNFYGTAGEGGSATPGDGNGTVFKITPSGSVTIMHSFGDGSVTNDGTNPVAGLVLGSDGYLYGTTENGGVTEGLFDPSDGTVFRLPPVPAAPTGLTATADIGRVTLSWTGSAGATSYNVYRGTSSGGEAATPIASGMTTTAYADTDVSSGVTYFYTAAAVNSSGASSPSGEAISRDHALSNSRSHIDPDDPQRPAVLRHGIRPVRQPDVAAACRRLERRERQCRIDQHRGSIPHRRGSWVGDRKGQSSRLSATVAVTVTYAPVTVATAAAANPNPVTGTTTTLSALGAYAGTGGASILTYRRSASDPLSPLAGSKQFFPPLAGRVFAVSST